VTVGTAAEEYQSSIRHEHIDKILTGEYAIAFIDDLNLLNVSNLKIIMVDVNGAMTTYEGRHLMYGNLSIFSNDYITPNAQCITAMQKDTKAIDSITFT